MQEIELKRPPTQMEVFFKTHTRNDDRSQWVDERSRRTYVSILIYVFNVSILTTFKLNY